VVEAVAAGEEDLQMTVAVLVDLAVVDSVVVVQAEIGSC
jgi:hypothetical protein